MEQEDSRIGLVLQDRYRILSHIAKGAMGIIYRGERLQLGRAVAIKFLHAPLMNSDEFLRRFEVEARAMSRLAHPHCVSITDFGVADVPYLVMEYVSGQTLRQVLDEGPMHPRRTLNICNQVLAGLAHAHMHRVVHRDIKPGNIIITECVGIRDHVCILDFGLAKLRDSSTSISLTADAIVVGTPSYMSPEQARSDAVDPRSDIYSMGVVLYEMLTGRKPFPTTVPFEALRMHLEEDPPTFREVAPKLKLSQEIEAAVRRSMAKLPQDRFQTALEFATTLAHTPEARGLLLAGSGPTAGASGVRSAQARPHRRSGRPSPSSRSHPTGEMLASVVRRPRRRLISVAVCLSILALAAGGGWFFWVQPHLLGGSLLDMGSKELAAASPLTHDARPAPRTGGSGRPVPAKKTHSVSTPESQPGRAPERIEGIQPVLGLLAKGQRDRALRDLLRLKVKHPQSAYLHFLLGELYFEKTWWTDGMRAYRQAIRLDSDYRNRYTLSHNLILALGRDNTVDDATALLLRDVGRAALPYLKEAARREKNARIKARAAALASRIEASGR